MKAIQSIRQGLGTTAFVATKVAVIVGAGLFAYAAGSALKDRFIGKGDEYVEGEIVDEDLGEPDRTLEDQN